MYGLCSAVQALRGFLREQNSGCMDTHNIPVNLNWDAGFGENVGFMSLDTSWKMCYGWLCNNPHQSALDCLVQSRALENSVLV